MMTTILRADYAVPHHPSPVHHCHYMAEYGRVSAYDASVMTTAVCRA